MTSLPTAPVPPAHNYGDQLIIETPEQTAVEFPIAGVGSRFLAFALDTLIQVIVFALAGGALAILSIWTKPSASSVSSLWVFSIFILFFFVVYYGYFAIFESIWNGQTPGKRVAHIRVIKESGRSINPAESVARNVLRLVDQLPVLYGIGIVSILVSRRSKRLGDFVAGTIVVHERGLQDIKPLWQDPQTAPTFKYGSHRLSPEDFGLVEAFLNRRNSLEPDVRYQMADQIVSRIRDKISTPSGEQLSGEKLLEAIAQERRSSAGY